MHRGWVKLHRKIADNELWLSEKFTRGQAWVDMIMLANHQDGCIRVRGIKVQIKRGELGWSEIALAERWKWSRGKVRRFKNELKMAQKIAQKTVQQNQNKNTKNGTTKPQKTVQQKNRIISIITILNYEQYQGDGTIKPQETVQETVQQNHKKRYTNKNVFKNDKNKDSIKDLSKFDIVWGRYPKKDGKKQAIKHYNATVKNQDDFNAINLALDNYLSYIRDNNIAPRYIKNGSTWFNNWRDWVDIKIMTPASSLEQGMRNAELAAVDLFGGE